MLVVAAPGFAASASAGSVTNAYDAASHYSSFTGNQGFGFGPWTVNTPGGGRYISGDATPYFGLWNNTANSASTANRPFITSLSVGQTFHVQLQMNTLDGALNTNGFRLQDAAGNTVFSYWHQGGDIADGHYSDAGVIDGTAVGFAYNHLKMDSFAFTFTSPTTYTFADLSTGASFDGTLSVAAITQVTFFRANGNVTPGNGQDFKFNTLVITAPSEGNDAPDRARIAFDAYNAAFLVRANGETYYKRSLTNNSYAGTWVQALEIQLAEDAYDRSGSWFDKQLVNDLLTTFLAKENYNWAFNTWNDDIAWMSIACLRGYEITGNPAFLAKATSAWNMAFDRGWDSDLGGGIWEEMNLKDAKCALSNDPMIVAGTGLYRITGQSEYLTKCQNIYSWVRQNIFNPTNGQVYEGVNSNGTVMVSDNVYNSGAFINAANCLFQITGATNYYQDALLAAKHVIENNAILTHSGRGDSCWEDQFARGLANFARDNELWGLYGEWMAANADAAWNARRTDLDITWNAWANQTPTDDSFSLECLSAAVIQQVLPKVGPDAPGFALQPSDQVTASGNAVTLSAIATNGQSITYQWYREDRPIPGATGTNLLLLSVTDNDAGRYWVAASNSTASSFSRVASVYLIGNANGFVAFDSATNYSAQSGLTGNQGFGFGPWLLSTMGGGSYISGNPPRFALWNSTASAQSTASRSFNLPLRVGDSFLLELEMNSLNAGNRNGFSLHDSAGNTIFTFWHQGGDVANGHYSDANGRGIASDFAYNFGQMDSFRFTLTSPTSYTFTDLTMSKSISGRLSAAAISAVTFFRSNSASTPSGGQDFRFNNLIIMSSPSTPVSTLLEMGRIPQGWNFHFRAAPGYRYRLQRATNLLGSWTDIGTLTGPATGLAQFVETNEPAPESFYRTIAP